MEFSETFPHLKYLDEVGLMKNVKARYNNNGRLLGIDYKKDGGKTFQRIIIRGKGLNEFEYGTDKNSRNAIDEFKTKLESAQAAYEETGSGMFESEIRSEVGSILDDKSEQTVIQKRQELEELNQMVEEETQKAKFELIEEVEKDMQGNRDYLLATFGKFVRDEIIAPFEVSDYLNNVENLVDPISNMDRFRNNELLRDDEAADKVYDQQMKYIEDNIKDIEKRIAEEEAKGDAKNKDLIKAYKELRDYLDLKIDSLNLFFDCPVKAEYFQNKIRRLVKKNARLAFERTKKWVKKKMPEFLAGIVVSVGGIVFSVYELAEAMGRGIMEKGTMGKRSKSL